jgi:hypothetical protein
MAPFHEPFSTFCHPQHSVPEFQCSRFNPPFLTRMAQATAGRGKAGIVPVELVGIAALVSPVRS